MPKINQEQNKINNNNNQTQINFQQKKRIFGANISNNFQAEKQTNCQKQVLLEEPKEADYNSRHLKSLAATAIENNFMESTNNNNDICNQAENNKAFVFNLNNKNNNRKFFNKKSNKNEKSNSSLISAKNSSEGSAFLSWMNKQNNDNKVKNKANKACKNNLSHNFNPKTSAFELVHKKEVENSFAESDKENIDASNNSKYICLGANGNKFKGKLLQIKETDNNHKGTNENNNNKNKNEINKNKKLKNFLGELNENEFAHKENLITFAPLTCRNNTDAASKALDLIESQEAKSSLNSNQMDIISEDNAKGRRVSFKIKTDSKESNLSNKERNNSQNGCDATYTNPFSVNNFNNADGQSLNNEINNSYFYPKLQSNKKEEPNINHAQNIGLNINNNDCKNSLCSNQGAKKIQNEDCKMNAEAAFLQPQKQIKSSFLNFNKNLNGPNGNNTSRTGFMLNRENSVILNKNKSNLNTSGFLQNTTSHNQINDKKQSNDETLINQENERFCSIQQQNVNLNTNINSNSQNQVNNNAAHNQKLNQAEGILVNQADKMQIENSSQINQSASQANLLNNNQQAAHMQSNSSAFTFNPYLKDNNNFNNFNNNFASSNNINSTNNCFANTQIVNPASFFPLNPSQTRFPNNLHNNNGTINNIFSFFQQNPQLINLAKNHNSIIHNPNNFPLSLQQNITNNNMLITQNAISAMNNAYNNCSNNVNRNNYQMPSNFAAINNPTFNYNFNPGMNIMNNLHLNQQFAYPNINVNNHFNYQNKAGISLNHFQMPNESRANCYINISQNPIVDKILNEKVNSKQTASQSLNPSSKVNLKENNKSLCIDTKVCNENFEKQIKLMQVESTTTLATTANNLIQANNTEKINSTTNNITNSVTSQIQMQPKNNQKQTLLETICSNINRRLKVNKNQNQNETPSSLTAEAHLKNIFLNSIVLQRLKPTSQILIEYLPEFLNCLKNEEEQLKYNFHFRKNHPDITEKMRIILISWITEVHRKFRLLDETLYLCVHLIDSCLHSKSEVTWTKANFQLLGISALLLACKYEEIYFPDISDFHCITDRAFSISEILECEFQICKILDYFVLTCYPIRFLELYRFMFDLNDSHFLFCKLILEITLMDSRFLEFDRSLIALSAVFVMGRTMPYEFEAFEALFYAELGNRKAEFKECVRIICLHLDNSVQLDSFKIIKERYEKSLKRMEEIYAYAACNKEKHD